MPGFEVFGEEERKAINDLFDANGGILFAHGFDSIRKGIYRVREFEASVSQKFQVPYAQAVSSGSAALRVALAALNVGPGDEVIIPAFTYIATAEAVLQAGADLVIVDIDESFNMDPNAFGSAISPQTKAVIPVHMMGAPAEMDRIMEIAQASNVSVVEDAAQGVGGKFKGQSLGTIGDLGCFSFDAGKVIITGEGGMVVTSDQSFYEKARSFHDHGHKYLSSVPRGLDDAVSVGFNYRMMELQGAIGIVQLSKLDFIISSQRKNKAKLKSKLVENNFPFKFRKIHDQNELGDALIFMLENREQALKFLDCMKREGLATKNIPDAMRWHFAKHWKHLYANSKHYKDSYQNQWQRSADILESSIAIPIMIRMSDEDIEGTALKLLKISKEVM